MELWDAYDKDFKKHVDGTLLLMQRDLRRHYGGIWYVY